MRKNIKLFTLVLGIACVQSCQKDTKFLITETSVGPLSQDTKIEELETVFALDSMVRDTTAISLATSNKKIEVFEKGGKHLLSLTPCSDSIQKVENVRIMDKRYVSNDGIGLTSTFGDIQRKYSIKKIVATLNSVVIFPENSNLYFTIDKEELPENLRFSTKVEEVQIPDEAKIKYLMLGWE